MQAIVVDRIGNAPISDADRKEFTIVTCLDELHITQ
jgi:hypothetical protein